MPDGCYILAYGRAKALYQFPITVNNRINDYAKKILRSDRLPTAMKFGK